jgi:hypothetical protein
MSARPFSRSIRLSRSINAWFPQRIVRYQHEPDQPLSGVAPVTPEPRNGVFQRGPIRRDRAEPDRDSIAQNVYLIATLPNHASGGRVPYTRSKFWK